jgi:fatty-acyl-CoA synthase
MRKLTQSYCHAGGSEPLLGLTVGGVLDRAVRQWPHDEALIVPYEDVRWSWTELRRHAKDLAAGLNALGLGPGDRIGIVAPNCAEWVSVQFGSAYAGLILVNINPAYRLPELEYALNKAGCRAVVTAGQFKRTNYISMLREPARATRP